MSNLFENILEVAKDRPQTPAVRERTQTYSYHDLMDAVAQLTDEIDARQPSHRPILVFGSNDFITLAAMLAANLSGRTYIPVDAHTPTARIAMIVKSSRPSLVISTHPLSTELKRLFRHPVTVGQFQPREDFQMTDIEPAHAVADQDAAYIIYTSGTTGTPKGVAVSVNNLQSFTEWMNTGFSSQKIKNNQILEQPPYSFDLSIFSIYPSLVTGGTLVTLTRDETINFKLLFERLNTSTINTWVSTPSFVDLCLADPSFVADRHPQLTQFIFCGEELTKKTAEKLLAAFPEADIYNTYGPTEATGAVTSLPITRNLLEQVDRVPLGFPKPGVKISIANDEIIISGDSVALGYFEAPEKTAEAFYTFDYRHAYHTGDSGYIDKKGLLHYKGRIDFQVKFKGYRIELQDIEAHLRELPEVDQAVVLTQENESHQVTALIAALSLADKSAPTPDRAFTKSLKAALSDKLMDYMMPTRFVYLNQLPLNQNGKIDRAALKEALSLKK